MTAKADHFDFPAGADARAALLGGFKDIAVGMPPAAPAVF